MDNGKLHKSSNTAKSSCIVDLSEYLINGVDQWVLARGNSIDNPILLYLHGGPCAAEMFNRAAQSPLEEYYIVVNWDQRGAGKSYSKNIPLSSMNVDQFVSDAIELINILRMKFNKEKIYLMGHSWGSMIGMLLIKQHPELFHAYIGLGQVVDFSKGEVLSYQYTLERAKTAANKKAIKDLERIGLPPYESALNGIAIQRNWLSRFGGVTHRQKSIHTVYETITRVLHSKAYSLNDFVKFIKGINFTLKKSGLIKELYHINLFELIPEVKIPVYFFVGRYDYNTPWELAEQYFKSISAPYKRLVWFEHSAHSPNIEEKEKFCEELIRIVHE